MERDVTQGLAPEPWVLDRAGDVQRTFRLVLREFGRAIALLSSGRHSSRILRILHTDVVSSGPRGSAQGSSGSPPDAARLRGRSDAEVVLVRPRGARS